MKEITANLLQAARDGKFDVLVHGQNCWASFSGGIALEISNVYPEVMKRDVLTIPGDPSKLGTINWVTTKEGFVIVNAYTQFDYTINKVDVDYIALRSCFKAIKREFSGKRIAYPLIGCGVAGGDWATVEKIIDEELKNEDHTLVRWDGTTIK